MSTSTAGQRESLTQQRVVALFREVLDYRYLGNRIDRENRPIETAELRAWLTKCGYRADQIDRALDQLHREANNPTRSLYGNNQAVYALLRYGAKVKTEAGVNTADVWFVDWQHPEANDFAIAEEVTLQGGHERRPELVLYVNGLAVGVIELKRSTVGVTEGIRQLLSNQQPEFNAWFFSTVQFVFAGNDSEGLRCGIIG